MTVSSTTARVSYSGNGATVTFAVNFYFLEDSHLQVIIRSATGTETVKTLLTDYTVTGAGNPAGGSITFGTAPTNTETIVITRAVPLTQQTDYLANDPFPAESHEEALDKLTMMVQQQQDALDRSIKLSVTNTIGSAEFTVGATDRADKILAFDSAGELAVTQEIGTYRGNWATSTSYQERDLIQDTSNDNIYICVEAHTSTGTQPISTNADVAKWALIVDAASAAAILASAEAARDAAQLAETNAEAAELSANNWATKTDGPVAGGEYSAKYHALAASSSATDAQNAQTAAESARDQTLAAFDSFDDRYLGTKTADPTLDNDGNPLVAGALYFNSVSGIMKVYTGSTWVAAYVSGDASSIAFTPVGDISATNVQAALQEVDSEKLDAADIGVSVQAYDADTAKTDVAQTFSAKQTFAATQKIQQTLEKMTVSATAATGTIAYDALTQAALYYTTNASANWTVNFRGDSGNSLDSIMATGESLTLAFLVTNGATAYYNSAVQIDGNSVTPKWQGGTAPTSGNTSSIDMYVYNIVKTGSATFTVFAAQTQFK